MECFPDLNKYDHIHFIGIGGVSMSSLAVIVSEKGKTVSGSDSTESAVTQMLKDKGIKVFTGHNGDNISGAQLIVYTAAIKDSNPELVRAKETGIPAIERAVLLGMLMSLYPHSIAVAGTHGKSTTSSMLSSIFLDSQYDPTILIGAHFDRINANFKVGASEYAVYEACEYVNSFHHFYPDTAIILNIDADHLDFFKDIDDIRNSFKKFIENVNNGGTVIINGDDKNCKHLADGCDRKVITFGLGKHNDCYAQNISFENGLPVFDVIYDGKRIENVRLSVLGEHNIMNALASVCCALSYGLDTSAVTGGLLNFKGADRRFQIVKKVNGADIADDYAHHPTEISATLRAAKSAGYKKITVIFQPHTYTRAKILQDDFAKALSAADEVILTDIYSAREINTIGASVMDIVNKIPGAKYISSRNDIADYIRSNARPSEVYILMGAGDINKTAELL